MKTNKALSVVLAAIICFALLTGSVFAVSGGGETYKLGYFLMDGYHETDESGMKSGYGYEYMQRLRAYTGWQYDYVGDNEGVNWPDMLNMLENGEIDILTSVSKTEERVDKFEFSELPIGTKSTLLTVKAGNYNFSAEDYDNWNNIKIGMLKNSTQREKLDEFAKLNGFTYQSVYFDSDTEQNSALQSGAVDAILSSDLRSMDNEWIIAKFSPQPFYICVKKGRNELVAQINSALEQIHTTVPNLADDLHKKYYSAKSCEEIYFTAEEREYISGLTDNGKTLTALVNPDMRPYCYFDGGKASGSLTEIASVILTRAGLPYEIKEISTAEEYWRLVSAGEADLVLDAFYNDNLAERYGYIACDSYYNMSLSAVTLNERGFSEANKVAIVENGQYIQSLLFKSELAEKELIICSSVEECTGLVLDRKADAALLYTNTALAVAEEEITNRLNVVKLPLVNADVAIASNSSCGPLLSSIINKATAAVSQSEILDITQKYLDYSKESTLIAFLYDHPMWGMTMCAIAVMVISLVVVVIITEKHKNQIRRLNVSITKGMEAAQKASKAKTQFLAQMSHEIRTLMNAIIGITNIAKAEIYSPEKTLEYLGKIETSSKSLLGIINDVLDMSAVEAGKMKIEAVPFDFKELVSDITAVYYQQAKQRGLCFKVNISGVTEERLVGDMLRVNQILLNLLSNAVKFTPQGGTVTLGIVQASCSNDKAAIRFTVSDTGCGMSKDMLERLFQPFEQESVSTARKFGGSGLGLSITKNLVELMNGLITVDSKVGVGTTFTVDITFDVDKRRGDISGQIATAKSLFSDIRTLVVDDDVASRQYTGLLLDRLDVSWDCVSDGEMALEALGNAEDMGNPYKLCIIDWKMPDMDGIQVSRRIREIFGEDTVIIIVSAYDVNEIRDSGKEVGVNYFMSKPLFQSTVFNALTRIAGGDFNSPTADELINYNFTGKRVLIAEDVALNMEVAVKLLKMAGTEVVSAENGKQAVEIYEHSGENEFDCILLDINMPVMDGYAAAREIRMSSKPNSAAVPIYAMTANAFPEDIAAALEAGMNGHISKPIETAVLYKTLKNAFDMVWITKK